MLKGNLFYEENNDKWILKTSERDMKINSLIYGLADVGIEFEGEGEFVEISVTVKD